MILVQCMRCGGWHDGAEAPRSNCKVPDHLDPKEVRRIIVGSFSTISKRIEESKDPYEKDSLPNGDGKLWHSRVYGVDERGEKVTIAFGREGGTRAGHVMIADGHVHGAQFYEDETGAKGHDHIGPGPGKDANRGQYTGYEAFHDPE
jgi:hypothetical protein